MDQRRSRDRITVDIPVTITTVLDSMEGRIVDLTEHGAQIADVALPRGAKFHVEYLGQTVFAQCLWSEVDRMGARFPFDLAEGPLLDALMLARAGSSPQNDGYARSPAPFMLEAASPGAFQSVALPGSFGRRRGD